LSVVGISEHSVLKAWMKHEPIWGEVQLGATESLCLISRYVQGLVSTISEQQLSKTST